MGSAIRKIQRGKEKAVVPSGQNGKQAEQLMQAWNRGFDAGVKEQRKADIEHMASRLEGLKQVPGIGEKTAWKVREFFLEKFRNN